MWITAREGTIQQQLSTDMGIDPSAMVKLINELEEAGLAERRRRPNDRRAWEVKITPKGRHTLQQAKQMTSNVEDEILRGLTAADRRQLLALLRRALASAPPQPHGAQKKGTEPTVPPPRGGSPAPATPVPATNRSYRIAIAGCSKLRLHKYRVNSRAGPKPQSLLHLRFAKCVSVRGPVFGGAHLTWRLV